MPNEIQDSYRATQSIGVHLVAAIAATTTSFEVELADTSTSQPVGITQDVSSTNSSVNITSFGRSKAVAGASVSAGSILGWQTATGKVVAITNNTSTSLIPSIGKALQSGSSDSTIDILVLPGLIGGAGV